MSFPDWWSEKPWFLCKRKNRPVPLLGITITRYHYKCWGAKAKQARASFKKSLVLRITLHPFNVDCPVFRFIHIIWSIEILRLIRDHDPIINHHYHQLLPRFSSLSVNHDSRLICAWYLSITIPFKGSLVNSDILRIYFFRGLLDSIEYVYMVPKRNILISFWIYGLRSCNCFSHGSVMHFRCEICLSKSRSKHFRCFTFRKHIRLPTPEVSTLHLLRYS